MKGGVLRLTASILLALQANVFAIPIETNPADHECISSTHADVTKWVIYF